MTHDIHAAAEATLFFIGAIIQVVVAFNQEVLAKVTEGHMGLDRPDFVDLTLWFDTLRPALFSLTRRPRVGSWPHGERLLFRSRSYRQRFMEALCLSVPNDTDSSDTYSPTGAQSQSWRGTIGGIVS